mgnify:CR=1 FL=1
MNTYHDTAGITGLSMRVPAWQAGSQSADTLRTLFIEHAASGDPRLVQQGFRAFSAELLGRDLIGMDEYASLFGGHALYQLTVDAAGQLVHAHDGACAHALACRYSRAKYGSIEDIRFFAHRVTSALTAALDDAASPWRRMFERAGQHGEQVVMLTTGWRNVPSTANVLFEIVVEQVNFKLAYLQLPTLINVKLPRIAPPCENYASLTADERERVSAIQDHVLPASNFYQSPGVHVVFGDDVLVTGGTADKVYASAMANGAKSFMAIYPLLLDPVVALRDPAVEERLNMTSMSGTFDDAFASVLSDRDYVPILRSLRTLLDEQHQHALPAFLPSVPSRNLSRLYVSALNNEFLRDPRCAASLATLRAYLTREGALDAAGFPLLRA